MTPSNTNTPTATQTPTFTPTPSVPIFSNATFTYDGDGRRVKSVLTTNVGVTTTYFVGAHYEVVNGVVTKYYYAGSQRIAMRKNSVLSYLLSDHLGSASLVTNSSGTVVNQTKYKAWGETRYSSGTEQTKYTYTGQYSYTTDFGLMFYNARWYDSSLGRFAQADSIIPAGVQGLDRYSYTFNNPIRYTDPSGHDPCDEEGNCYNSQGWYRAPHAPRLSTVDTWKMMIKGKFGINMSEEPDIYNLTPKAWNATNLQNVWRDLNQINGALNGKLKSLVGGATFKWGDYAGAPCSNGRGTYCGYTYGTTITFYNIGQAAINQQNIFHEFGHLLDNSLGDVFSLDPNINNADFLDGLGYLDRAALISRTDEMVQNDMSVYTDIIPGDMVTAQGEHWADMFANYVAGNIDLDSPEGRAMNNFVQTALSPHTGFP